MNRPSPYYLLSLLVWIGVPILAWIDLKKAVGSLGAMAATAAILAALVVLLLLERLLGKPGVSSG